MKSSRHFSQLKIKNRTKMTILNSFYGLVLFGLIFQPFINSFINPVQAAPPTVSAISPNIGDVSGGQTVTITGTNFKAPSKVEEVSDGVDTTSCALATNHDIYCWGTNWTGQLGTGTYIADSNAPVKVKMDGALAGKTVTDIDSGLYYACAVADGKPYCWGENVSGQLGNNSTTDSWEPTAVNTSGVLSGKTVTKVSAGFHHACAIADGQAYCWGAGTYGALGHNSTSNSLVPVAVSTAAALNGKTVTDITVGERFTCAIADNLPYCWGYGEYSRLGRGSSSTNTSVPVALEIASGSWAGKTITHISVGESHGCLLASNVPYCWGNNWGGQIGNNSTTTATRAVPITTGALSGKTVTDINAGVYYSCAIADGQQYCWGYNGTGQLGDGSDTDRLIPTAMATGAMSGKTVTGLGGGSYEHSCSIADDALYCTGEGYEGSLGAGNYNPSAVHVTTVMTSFELINPQVLFDGVSASSVSYVSSTELQAVTPSHGLGLKNVTVINPGGESYTYANSFSYRLPAPTITSVSPASGQPAGGTPVTITGTGFNNEIKFSDVVAASSHSCAIGSAKAFCWGNNANGQLGDGTSTTRLSPVAVSTSGALAGKTVTDIDSDEDFTCTVADGKAYCWGNGADGRLGTGDWDNSLVPVAVDTSGVLNGKTITATSTGSAYACSLDINGKAYCWGNNVWGQLGNNSTNSSDSPVAVNTAGVLNGKNLVKITSGWQHSCGIDTAGKAYCWGGNSQGQLGNNSTTASSVPVAVNTNGVLNGKIVTDIHAGDENTCAVASGKAYCWGFNYRGQLGNNSTTASSVPVAVNTSGVLSGKIVTDITGFADFSCALANGHPYCWGYGGAGSLGDGNYNDSLTPVAVDTSQEMSGLSATHISSGYKHSCTIANGSLFCWGGGEDGQIGDGESWADTTPTAVLTTLFKNVPTIAFGSTLATNTTYTSSTQLTATTPAHTPGNVNVTVTNPDAQVGTLTNGYQYLAVAPGAPTGLSTTPSQNGVALNWTAPTNNGGATITNYLVEYSSNGGSSWNTFSHPPSASTNIIVNGLSAGTTYTFRVSAINSAGTGSPSSTATGTPVYVTLQSDNDISIDITPNGATTVSSNKHTLSLNTNNPNGFQITIEMASGTRNLVNGAHTISPASGSLASPTSLLVNTWGYRIDSAGGFGSGPTVTETNVSSSGYSWAGVPASGNPTTIKSSPTPQLNNTTVVWYGLNASNTKASGYYTGTILYTAIAG